MTTTDLNNDTGTDGSGRKGKVSAAAGAAAEKVREGTRAAGEKLSDARTRASDAYSSARERTGALYGTARERASSAGRRTADTVTTNPAGALVAGLAIGALAAALLPKTRRETETFGKFGTRINETAREAARAAREAGRGKLDELGVNAENAKQKLSEVASTSASAAAQKVKGSQQTP
jgi:ElaB/YqjD/DUF883 family membrane-anchored ribosome-binding protein